MLETAASAPRQANLENVAERLAREAPALVLAPLEARLVAANRAGADVLGVPAPLPFVAEIAIASAPTSPSKRSRGRKDGASATAERPAPTNTGHPLDSAMPALVQLRRIAGRGMAAGEPRIEPLVFWTPAGAARLLCRVRPIEAAAHSSRLLMLIEPLDAGFTPLPPVAMTDGEQHSVTHRRSTRARPRPDAFDWPVETDETETREAGATEAGTTEAGADTPQVLSDDPPPENIADAPPAATRQAPIAGPSLPRTDAEILKAIAGQILAASSGAGAGSPGGVSPPAGGGSGDGNDESRVAPTAPVPAGDKAAHGEDTTENGPATGGDGHEEASRSRAAAPATQAEHDLFDEADAISQPEAAELDAPPRAVSARRALTRRLAHELKSPLSAIAAASEIMKDQRFGAIGDERYLRYARDIHESARHALDVIQRMLGTHVGGDATPELAFVNLDLNGLVSSLVSAMGPIATDAGIRLAPELAPGLPLIVADTTSLRQIVHNLLGNALKFTPRGGIVTVSTRAAIDGPLYLEIADTGPGMSAEEIARMLDDTATAEIAPRKGGGLGIGLPLVRALAASNGAELGLAPRASGGLVATIAFPKSRQVLV
ncbi:MAG: HAMP domain-containing histidine kinase [Hyphomicrobiaceae bacterium]|nr:HAMP domain-containing histidine kinase [Hyphomicrobiaceae bacterium]